PHTYLYILPLHDALPILEGIPHHRADVVLDAAATTVADGYLRYSCRIVYPPRKPVPRHLSEDRPPVREAAHEAEACRDVEARRQDRKSTRLNSSHVKISY